MHLSYFKDYTSKQPKHSTLQDIVEMIRADERLKSLTNSYRLTHEKAIKESCPLFGVAARFEGGKRKEDVVALTGLSLVDIDHVGTAGEGQIDNGQNIDALRAKAEQDPHTLLCYTTISGEGLRILFRYELDRSFTLTQQIQYYWKVFAAGNAYYSQLLSVTTDKQCKNVTRLSGLAHDARVFCNTDAVAFTIEEIEEYGTREVEREKVEKRRNREWIKIERAYERKVRPEVEADGAVYAPGHHNDYVMRVGYKLCHLRFNEEVAVAWARKMFPDYDKTEEVIRACFKSSPLPSSTMAGDRNGSWANVTDIRRFLSSHIRLRHNVITGRVEYADVKDEDVEDENGKSGADHWLPITDRVVNSLWAEISQKQRVNVQDVYRVIESDFIAEYQPFEAYLRRVNDEVVQRDEDQLPPDGQDAIAELSRTVTVKGSVEQQMMFETYLRKWLVAMVAAWIDPSVVNNVILVLIGEQGTYKTTWFNHLLPPELQRYFYTKTNANRMGRDDLLTLSQYGLICCEELDTMRPAELNQLKAAVTMPSIDERAAYAHFHEHRKHIASFCGTGNNIQFLNDPTGNRRWLPFEVESIRSPREHPFDYERIYAEAYRLYKSGFQYWFSREEIQQLNEHNHHFETPRLERELVQEYFRPPMTGETGEFMSVALALQIIACGISQKLSAVNIGRAFRELGFEQRVVRHVRGYIVVRYTTDEMQQRRKLAAMLE